VAVDYNKFVDWAQNRFASVGLKGNEVCIDSVFTEDNKKKLWCNPFGGKNKIRYGVYHCWKTDKKGTLVNLVMQVDKCTKKEALERLGITAEKRLPIDDIDFNIFNPEENFELDFEKEQKEISLPPFCYKINLAPEQWHQAAEKFLLDRKISPSDFYVCTQGKYSGRIIIPYLNSAGKLIYFNGRTIIDHPLRYKGPEKEIGVGKSDVIYFPKTPVPGSRLYLCEGEFDAYALYLCGLNAAACGGKFISEKQAVILSQYNVVVAVDADEAGQKSIPEMANKILQFNIHDDVFVVKPPATHKDWNELFLAHEPIIVKSYIMSNEKRFS
jgi:DNA primase